MVSASNYDVVSIAGNLLIYTTPSFEALTKISENEVNSHLVAQEEDADSAPIYEYYQYK